MALGALVLVGCTTVATAVIVLHLGVRPVLTGSMRPAYGPGAVLITKPVPIRDLHAGMIPVFVPPGEHAEFAHRIVSVTGPASDPMITTKGDANRALDPWRATFKSATVPVVVATVPFIGRLMVGLRGPLQLAMIIAGGLIVAFGGVRWIVYPRHPDPVGLI
jgi:signal peptidase